MTSERRKGELFLGGPEAPYSKGLMARALTAVGVGGESAYELARRTEADLAQRGEASVDLDRLRELAIDVLGEEGVAREAALRQQVADQQKS